ncbi:LysM peptidoglycan-binding domain-containing protein [Cytobacillus sp. Hm23]
MQIHVVQSGDALWSIAQRYGADINQIIKANGMKDPNVLVVGQALVIPSPTRQHVVQPGEDLWRIAQMYGVSVQSIIDKNAIADPNRIQIGQYLTIPVPLHHVVQPGEMLWMIAQRYGVSVQDIAVANQLANPDLIFPGQVLRIPERVKQLADVNAYITRMGERGVELVDDVGNLLTYLSIFEYAVKEDGTISTLSDKEVIEAAEKYNIGSLMVISNLSGGNFDSDLTATIFASEELQDTLITNILETMKEKGYVGLNVDFEFVYPEDRENYNNFLRKTVARLHPEGLSVSTALAPKVTGTESDLLRAAHDYQAHGEIVDMVFLMTYEWGWSGGPPLAIAPLNSVRKVLDYAVTVIPRDKILMGIPLYGRDWNIPFVQGTSASTLSPQAAVERAGKYGATIEYDPTYQSPFFRYYDEEGAHHEVWFEDARSIQAKLDTVKEYHLRGLFYWVLGLPFPQNWYVLDSNFKAHKHI